MLQRDGNLKNQNLGCVVGSEEQSEFFNCCLRVLTWVWLYFFMLKEDFSNIFARLNYLETLLQGFKCVIVQICVNGFTTWHNMYQNHPFCIPNNSGHDLCWRGSLKILPRSSWMIPFHWMSFYLPFEVMTPCKINNPSVGVPMKHMLIVDLQNVVPRK